MIVLESVNVCGILHTFGNFSPSDLVVLKVAKDMSCINCHQRRTCQQEEPQDTKSQHLLTRFGGN